MQEKQKTKRYKRQLSIYVKESWLDKIAFFADKNEESVSEYVERAISFQLLHDEKAWKKTEAANRSQEEKIRQLIEGLDVTQTNMEDLQAIDQALIKAMKDRKTLEIIRTPWITTEEND